MKKSGRFVGYKNTKKKGNNKIYMIFSVFLPCRKYTYISNISNQQQHLYETTLTFFNSNSFHCSTDDEGFRLNDAKHKHQL